MWTSLLFAGLLVGQDSAAPALPPLDPAVQADALSAHVHYLASDAMKGRMTAAPETRAAAEYIAAVLARAGVAPAGDDGTYFQAVPLVTYDFPTAPELVVEEVDGTTWTAEYGTEFRLRVRGVPDVPRRLALHGVANAPSSDVASDAALYVPGTRTEYPATLSELGFEEGSGLGLLVLEGSEREGRAREMRGDGMSLRVDGPDLCDHVVANARLLEAIEAGRVAALTLRSGAKVEEFACQNVVGILRGVGTPERPELAAEAVVLSAHYDHIGHRDEAPAADEQAGEDVDTINNGADDDASGVAAVLEVAEALGAGEPPARTVVFLLATGEERGLLGTEVYLDDPVVPLSETLYNLNLEMIGRPDPLMPGPGELWLTGWEYTTLGQSLAGADQPVHPDPRPEQGFYQRSDNIAFVRRGVMGQTLSSFGMHTDYHRVTDEPDTLDYAHMETATKNVLRVIRALAVEGLAVKWVPAKDR